MNDIFYMKRAIKISKLGMFTTSPNPNVGCVIVKNNAIVGEGWHEQSGKNHAEINALIMAGNKAKGGTAYITLEPCNHFGKTPPCCNSLVKSGIKHVIISNIDPNPKVSGNGISYLKKNGITVKIGLLSQESKKYNKGFFKRMKTGLPWTQLKLAMSVDGRIAMKNGESKWITSKYAREDVQKFRLKNSALLSSSATILSDNSLFNIRYEELDKHTLSFFPKKLFKHPIRVIIDSQNRITPLHNIIQTEGKIWLMRLKLDQCSWPKHISQIISKESNKKIHILSVLKYLGNYGINNVWIEAGSTLSGFLLNEYLIDELILYIAPKMLGHEAKPLCILNNKLKLLDSLQFDFKDIRQIGPDIRLILSYKKTQII